MTALHERFAELADTSTPPSRLSADGVYGRARRRRRTRLAMSLAGGLSVLVGAGTAVVLSDLPKNESATPGHATVSTSSTADPGAWIYDGAVYGAAATDAQHLYALVNLCPTPTNCTGSLFGSDDGGYTWTLRSDHLVGDLTVHTPGELTLHSAVSALAPKGTSPDNTERVATSHDGGRTWTRVTTQVDSTPLPVVPNGGWLGCGGPSPARCLYAYTAGGAHRAPLANQPSLVHMHPMDLPASAGLWVAGEDPVSYRVGVAVSKDRGHTWSPVWTPGAGERDFPDCPNGEDAEVTSLDGMTAYAVVTCNSAGPDVVSRVLVYRTGDGGITWHRVDPGGTFPNAVGWLSYIAADGTHVVDAARTNPAQWWSSRDAGNTYQHATQLNGLPAEPTEAVSVLAPGLYLAFDRTAVYLSNNGIDWTRAAVSVPAR